jgi:hypothetical protein
MEARLRRFLQVASSKREASEVDSGAVHALVEASTHDDALASKTFLRRNTEQQVRPMARPVRFQWDNHEWRSTTDAPELGTNPNEQRTNP